MKRKVEEVYHDILTAVMKNIQLNENITESKLKHTLLFTFSILTMEFTANDLCLIASSKTVNFIKHFDASNQYCFKFVTSLAVQAA